jgi:hypothetical protein
MQIAKACKLLLEVNNEELTKYKVRYKIITKQQDWSEDPTL